MLKNTINHKRILTLTLFLLFIGISSQATAQTRDLVSYPAIRNERFVIQALRTIHGAEATYQGTTGSGDFGSLLQLGQLNLIDQVLAGGEKYGYVFTLTTQNRTPTTPANFQVVAVPRQYRRTGIRSFYIDARGTIHGADKQGAPADQNDSIITEEYTCGSVEECEARAISLLRTIQGAEATHQGTTGNGNFGSLCQLGQENLVDEILAGGERFGYYFVISHRERGVNIPATFEAIAIPRRYNQTGTRSFYIATKGVIHGADKMGAPATADDPPLPY